MTSATSQGKVPDVKRYGLFFDGGGNAWMVKNGHRALSGATWTVWGRLYDSFDTQEEAKAEAPHEKRYEIIDMRFWLPVYSGCGPAEDKS